MQLDALEILIVVQGVVEQRPHWRNAASPADDYQILPLNPLVLETVPKRPSHFDFVVYLYAVEGFRHVPDLSHRDLYVVFVARIGCYSTGISP